MKRLLILFAFALLLFVTGYSKSNNLLTVQVNTTPQSKAPEKRKQLRPMPKGLFFSVLQILPHFCFTGTKANNYSCDFYN